MTNSQITKQHETENKYIIKNHTMQRDHRLKNTRISPS